MTNRPDSPEECPICQRVESALNGMSVLKERLSENELAFVLETVQNAILNKEMNKTTRGINMTDEKYVISKSSFEDFYETQETLVSIIEKMVDRIDKQDTVIMKFGAALSDVIAKNLEGLDEYEEEEVADEPIDEEMPVEEEGVEEPEEEEVEDEAVGVHDEEVPPVPEEPDMLKAEKAAFEAGYKAAMAELQKKNGVPVTTGNYTYPALEARPVSTADAASASVANGVAKSLPDEVLAKMTPQQLNAWLRENKL